MSIVSDAIERARERVALRARTTALPCVVYLTGTRLDVESGTMRPYRRMVSATNGYDLVAGIDPSRGSAACHAVLCWHVRNFR